MTSWTLNHAQGIALELDFVPIREYLPREHKIGDFDELSRN